MHYASQLGLVQDLHKLLRHMPSGNDYGISLGCGTCWDAKILIDEIRPKKMVFLDYSLHRVKKIAPLMIRDYFHLCDECDILMVHGDYYETGFPSEFFDFITMSMALMMAEKPDQLLSEAWRLLKNGGYLIITGEPKVPFFKACKYMARILLRNIMTSMRGLDQTKDVLAFKERKSLGVDASGANTYAFQTYKRLFKKGQFKILKMVKDNDKFWGFLLKKYERY